MMSETAQYLRFLSAGVLIISLGYCKTESSSLFFVGFIMVVEEIYTSVACDLDGIVHLTVRCLLSGIFRSL